MKRLIAAMSLGWFAAQPLALRAHPMDQAAVLLDFRGGIVEAEVQVHGLASTPACSAILPDGRNFAAELVPSAEWPTLRFTLPAGASPDWFDFTCDLGSRALLVSIRSDWRTGIFANEP